jgi:hypothetical protein
MSDFNDTKNNALLKNPLFKADQKGLRCKARENRRAEAYLGSTLERGD